MAIRDRKLIWFLALTVLAGGGVLLWKSQVEEAGALEDARREIERVRIEMKDMESRQATRLVLNAQQARQPDGTAPGPGDGAPAEQGESDLQAASTEEAEDARQDAYTEEKIALALDSRFGAEAVDPAWADGAVREATRAISADLPEGTTLKNVECRKSMCRVDTVHADASAFRSFVSDALLSHDRQLWNGGMTSSLRETTDSGVTAVTYIAKDGEAIPAIDPDAG
jgi:hypothetical protein